MAVEKIQVEEPPSSPVQLSEDALIPVLGTDRLIVQSV